MQLYLLVFNYLSSGKKNSLPDEDLIEQIIETQNAQLVEVLYERYADKVYRRCIGFVKDTAIAEDLTHDIFIKVYLNLSSFRQKSKFSTWLYSVTYNFCIDYIRKRQKENLVDTEEEEIIANHEIDNTDDLNHIALDRLGDLMSKMKPEDRLILQMKYRDDMSIKEIQQAFDASESAVKMRIKRAKEKIKSLHLEMYEEIPI